MVIVYVHLTCMDQLLSKHARRGAENICNNVSEAVTVSEKVLSYKRAGFSHQT